MISRKNSLLAKNCHTLFRRENDRKRKRAKNLYTNSVYYQVSFYNTYITLMMMTIKFTTFWIQYKTYICSFLLKLNFYGLRSKNSVHYRTLNSGQCCIGMFCHFWFLWSFLRHWSLDNQVDLGQNKKLILSGLRYWCIIWLLLRIVNSCYLESPLSNFAFRYF